ncbi:MAG: hypothetical protein Q9172_005810 [Xanthocarpia lactea]
MEVSIVATSLLAITNELQGFEEGFLIIWAKLSDIFGRKLLIVTSLGHFVIFSGACGAAQTMNQLIVFRAMQGIGGAGSYSLVFVIFFEMVPPQKFARYSSMLSAVFALALLLGPLLGGAINNSISWRWIFLINIPPGLLTMFLLLVTIPKHFPHHHLPPSAPQRLNFKRRFSGKQLRRVDYLGTVLLLLSTTFLVTALQEADNEYGWNSAFIVTLLVMSGVAWLLFLSWSRKITDDQNFREPVFPWRLVQSRVRIGLLLDMLLTGAPFTVAVTQLPLKSQAVHGVSPLDAGIRLLPFAILSPIGSGIAAGVAGKGKVPPVYLLLAGSAVQIVGFTLLSLSPTSQSVSAAQYGYEAIAGFSIGVNLACLVLMTPFTVKTRDKSVAMSVMVQVRTMGGLVGLAIVTAAMKSHIKSNLAQHLSSAQIDILLKSTSAFETLPSEVVDVVKAIFAEGYNLQMRIMIGFSAAQIPVAFLMWKKKQILV